jgi:hypothetical protein
MSCWFLRLGCNLLLWRCICHFSILKLFQRCILFEPAAEKKAAKSKAKKPAAAKKLAAKPAKKATKSPKKTKTNDLIITLAWTISVYDADADLLEDTYKNIYKF